MKNIRNFCIIAHIDHGKSTLADRLLEHTKTIGERDMMNQVLDDMDLEREKGITIKSHAIQMDYLYNGEKYTLNLIDTPGHVDFGGDVTRAMRAVDGAIVLCCAVEGIMPQTETVLKQALRERVKPILFINKVDRLIKEVKLTPEAMQERFMKIISLAPEVL